MDPILETINEALKRSGLSDAAASKLAVGHPSLIKNLRMPREGEKRYNLPALMKLAEVLGLEFYFGPPRETGAVQRALIDDKEFAQIPLHSASLAAGHGRLNEDEAVIDHLAFRKAWLKRIGISESNAVLARATGDSMSPCIHDGDMVLIDRSKKEVAIRPRRPGDVRPAQIYALLDETGARVKRIERPEPDLIILLSDNAMHAPEVLTGAKAEAINVIGKVMWWGHTNRDT